MAGRSSGTPRVGYEAIAAAVALRGSERKAAAFLGISRSTVNGILRGVHGIGQKTAAAISNVPPAQKAQIEKTAPSFSGGLSGVKKARNAARQERKSPGTVAEQTKQAAQEPTTGEIQTQIETAVQNGEMTQETARTIRDGRLPGESVESAVRRLAGDGVWEQLQQQWAQGMTRGDWYELAIQWEYEGGGSDVEIESI